MDIRNCPNCGGDHFGSMKCPFTEAPCTICGDATVLACSDCAIDSGGKQSVHVCRKPECRDAHEAIRHANRSALVAQVKANIDQADRLAWELIDFLAATLVPVPEQTWRKLMIYAPKAGVMSNIARVAMSDANLAAYHGDVDGDSGL